MFFADSSRGTLIESYQGGVFLLDKSTLLLFSIRFFLDHPLCMCLYLSNCRLFIYRFNIYLPRTALWIHFHPPKSTRILP